MGQTGKLPSAVELLTRALKRDPRNAQIHYNLGETYRHLGNHAKALEFFERTVDAQSRPYRGLSQRRGHGARWLRRTVQAAGRWGEATRLKHMAIEFLIRAGKQLLYTGDQPGAAAALRRVTELDPKSAQAWVLYAMTLLRSYPSQAIQAVRRSINLDPSRALAWMVLCDALGSLDGATTRRGRRCNRRRSADPNHFDAFPRLSFVHLTPCSTRTATGRNCSRATAPGARRRRHGAGRRSRRSSRTAAIRRGVCASAMSLRTFAPTRFRASSSRCSPRMTVKVSRSRAIPPRRRPRHDRVTAQLKAFASLWRDTGDMDDKALRRQVRADRIDILIDLAGHTNDSQIMVFAARPAPVTATWLGLSRYHRIAGHGLAHHRCDRRPAGRGGVPYRKARALCRAASSVTDRREIAPEVAPSPVLAKGHRHLRLVQQPTEAQPRRLSPSGRES